MTDIAPTQVPAVTSVDVIAIMSLIPHRFPMLLIDRVEDIVLDTSARGIKAVSMNEPFFAGHFPGRPIMPGVLIIEAMAQTAGVLSILSMDLQGSSKLVYFMAIEEAKFRSPVEPGSLLELHVGFTQRRATVCKFAAHATVGSKTVAEARFTAMIADAPA